MTIWVYTNYYMDVFSLLPFIFFLIVIGTAVAERINVPYPLVLVVAGLFAGLVPGIPEWHPHGRFVLTLFLPPILFAAARLISWDDIRDNAFEIFSLSVVLVIVKTFAIACILSWLIPQMNFFEALVLGAIISPTDSIAATSILNKLNAKKHIVRTLEIESLFNDAVSIMLYKISVLFVFGGIIYLNQVTAVTIFSSLGGIALGLGLAYITGLVVKTFLRDSENQLPIIMGLILAYVSYIFAEKLNCSGVLAVCAAGLLYRSAERTLRARTRLSEKASWDTYVFFLNGLIFVVIGLQLPLYLQHVSRIPIKELVLFSLVTIFTLISLRFIWIALTDFLSVWIAKKFRKREKLRRFSWGDVLISSWSGMRGLVSLVLALALPTEIAANVPFPNRELIIFLTIITIVFTLLVQGLTLPYLVKWLQAEAGDEKIAEETDRALRHLTKLAIHYVETSRESKPCSSGARRMVDNYYESRLLQFRIAKEGNYEELDLNEEAENLLTNALEFERDRLQEMLHHGEISAEVYARIFDKLDREEVGFAAYK